MNSQKPRWEKPEIIVLVRGRPEEAVLAGCKTKYSGIGQFSATDCTKKADGRSCPQATHS